MGNVQSQGLEGRAQISFTVPHGEVPAVKRALDGLTGNVLKGAALDVESGIAKITIVGEGMRNHSGIASQMFKILADRGINIDMISTSEIKITVATDAAAARPAVEALHQFFLENS